MKSKIVGGGGSGDVVVKMLLFDDLMIPHWLL